MINGKGSRARTLLNTAIAKLITAPDKLRPIAWYADELARDREDAASSNRVPDTSSRTPASAVDVSSQLGLYRDPWFGDVSICARDGVVIFASAKSPQLIGKLMRVDDRLLVDWDQDDIDAEAWLTFAGPTLTLGKVDPDADFSYDYEDLAFTRVGSCP